MKKYQSKGIQFQFEIPRVRVIGGSSYRDYTVQSSIFTITLISIQVLTIDQCHTNEFPIHHLTNYHSFISNTMRRLNVRFFFKGERFKKSFASLNISSTSSSRSSVSIFLGIPVISMESRLLYYSDMNNLLSRW